MDLTALLKFLLAAMFSPPGIAIFVICLFLKQRFQATIAAVIASGAYLFFTNAVLSKLSPGLFSMAIIASVIGMMIAAHLAFTVGDKIIRKNSAQ